MVQPAERSYDARALEARVAAFWKETDAYQRTRAARSEGPAWYFLDGPPYATGHIHIGTARNKIIKDSMVRFMRQRGFRVRDQPGYDMHGLPIEVKVEKELGFDSKKDIEAFGIDRFVEACRTFAVDHLGMMNEEFKELGVWMDWDRPYRTIDNEYIEGAWWAIARAHERGLLFESERVLTWCWRCETALANAEIEFEDRLDPSIYVKFPVVEPRNAEGLPESLLIWTTTPWTLPANVAIAANPKVQYARVRVRKQGREEVLVVAADVVEDVARVGRYEKFEVLSTVSGQQLEGLRYRHVFADEVSYHREGASEWNNRVILGDHVAADRTGLVHTATGHGVEDFEAGRRYGIPVFSPVGDDGRYTDVAGPFQGLAVKSADGRSEADAAIIERLSQKDLLLAAKDEKHSYGHCWRCKNPIIYRATNQWFIEIGKIQQRMIEEVKRVEWTPEWAGSARQLDWVENARDWCISRQRYWGIPLPVWKCTARGCNEIHVVGSRKELARISDWPGEGDLHRPWIDKVRVACHRDGCGGVMKRVPDVLDVWFDSAVASWASLGWPGEREGYETWFPATWICEGLDQTRGWFYSQLGAGVAAMDRVPYDRVVMHGWVLDEKGRAMSKSMGNNVEPRDVLPKFGADALRFGILSGAAPWEDISFGTESLRSSQRTFNILWNVHVFATQYMATDGFDATGIDLHDLLEHMRPEDRWLVSRLQTTVADTTRFLESSEFHRAARTVEQFVLEDLSRWYVRLVRERVWSEIDSQDKRCAYAVLHESLLTTARLLAPFAPHVAEAVYQDLTEGKRQPTVHMEDWPIADGGLTDYDLEHDMASVRAAVDASAYARQKANMKLRWPVAKLVFATDSPEVRSALMRFEPLVLEQANTKSIEIVGGEWEHLHLRAVPNKGFIGRTYRQDAPAIVRGLLSLSQPTLRELRNAFQRGEGKNVDLEGVTIHATPELLGFETTLPEQVSGADFENGSVYVDTEITPELQAEGSARDLTRRVQEMRKLMGLEMSAPIATTIQAPEDFRTLVEARLKSVAEDTRSARIEWSEAAPEGELVREWDLEGTSLTIGISRAGTSIGGDAALPDATSLAPKQPLESEPPAAPGETAAERAAAKARRPVQTRLDSNEPAPADVVPAPARKKAVRKKKATPAAKKTPPTTPKTAAVKQEAAADAPATATQAPAKASKKSAKKSAARKSPSKKAAPKKAAAKKTTTAKKAPAKKGAAKKSGAKKATTKKAAKTTAKKAPAKKTAAKKTTASKTSATKKASSTKKGSKKAGGKNSAKK